MPMNILPNLFVDLARAKREAGYKAVKSFVEQLTSRDLVKFHDRSLTSREKTLVTDDRRLQQFADGLVLSGRSDRAQPKP